MRSRGGSSASGTPEDGADSGEGIVDEAMGPIVDRVVYHGLDFVGPQVDDSVYMRPTNPPPPDAMDTKPPLPPFTLETATHKVRLAEDAWNSRDPDRVVQVYTEDTRWRNRAEFPVGRAQVREFLVRKWARELDYRLIKELWAHDGARIAVRFVYEWHDDSGHWYRSHGNENWEFDARGLMTRRHASINDQPIREDERRLRWPLGRRPDDHPGLSALGL
jgi:nuclear transport factor 2 (NTF2) superfamily protein